MSYEWFKDGASIGTTRSNKLTLRKVKAADHDGTYSVKVANAVGEATSNDFAVTIIDAVDITTRPVSAGVVEGQAGQFTVTATGGGTLAYQWQKYDSKKRVWNDVAGATTAVLDIASMGSGDEGVYRCRVTNGPSTAYSKSATLSMYTPPTFKSHPRAAKVKEYAKLTLKAEALGIPAPRYQWQKLAADGTTWEDVSRANKSVLAFRKLYKEHAGKYRAVATSAGGTTISNEADIVVYYAPRISANLASQSANEGDTVTFALTAEALDAKGTSITYTWYKDKKAIKDGGAISGAGTPTLTLTGVSASEAGSYNCQLKNGAGRVYSLSAKLAVLLKPYASKPLRSLDLAEGKNATFSASIKGGRPLTYQWQKDGANIAGQTKNKLSLRAVKSSDAGTYKLIATNPAGTLELEATLAVTAAARIADTPAHDAELASRETTVLQQALGANPTTGQTFQPQIDTVDDGTGTTYLSFSYTENKSAIGMTYVVERSSDLVNWEPVDLSNASVNRLDRGTFNEVTVFVPANNGNGFLRVRVTAE